MYTRSPSGVATAFVALVVLLPPAAHVAYRELGRHLPPRVHDGADPAALERRIDELENERRRLAGELERAVRRLEVLEEWRRDEPDLVPRIVRILPVGDPSIDRHAFWIACRHGGPVPRGSVLVGDGAIVGTVGTDPKDDRRRDKQLLLASFHVAGRAIARVRTTLDPGFRVRVRVGALWGFVSGTGEVGNDDGLPVLRLHLLSGDEPIEAGTRVYTEGDDEHYPADLPVGEVVEQIEQGPDPSYRVRAAVHPERIAEAVLLMDRVLEAARAAIAEEESS